MSWITSPENLERLTLQVQQRRQRAQMSADDFDEAKAARLAQIQRDYEFLPTAMKVGLVALDVPDERIAEIARAEFKRRAFKGGFASVGDVVKGAYSGVRKAADFVAPEIVERGFGFVKDITVDRVAEDKIVRGVVRTGLAALQSGQEYIDASTRKIAQTTREGGVVQGLLETGKVIVGLENPDREDYTLGQMIEGKESGSGFIAGGEAAAAQAERARGYGTINGHAITLGRLGASTIFQPGSKPFNLLSGIIDMVPEVALDPGAIALKAVSKEAKARRGLTNVVSDATVQKAARKAGDEGDDLLRVQAGLVSGGNRPTVVPAAVDKYLFSDHANVRLDKMAKTSSPAAIWRMLDKKADVEVVRDIARAGTRADVLDVVRPAVGLGVDPRALRSSRVSVVPSLQRHVRMFNLVPDTVLPLDDPNTLIRNLDNTLANANVMGKERDEILDLAFDTVIGADNPQGAMVALAGVAEKAIQKSMIAHGADPELAKKLTSWTGDYVKTSRFLVDEMHEPVNLPFLLDDAGNPVTGAHPSALYQLLNRGITLTQPDQIREVRRLTSALNRVGAHSSAFQAANTITDFLQGFLWKMAVMVRPAYLVRVPGEEVVRSLGSGKFDNPLDWMAYAFGHRGAGDLKGNPFDLAKEADDLVERAKAIRAEHIDIDDATGKAVRDLPPHAQREVNQIQARLDEIQEEMLLGKVAYQNASARGATGKSSSDVGDVATQGYSRTGIVQYASRVAEPEQWQRGAADYLIAQSTDPILRRVANGGLLDGDKAAKMLPGLDGVREWLMNGTGTKFLRRMKAAYPDQNWNDPATVDKFLDIQVKHVQASTGDIADLRQAIVTGRINGKPIAKKGKNPNRQDPTDALKERVKDYINDPHAPRSMPIEVLAREGGDGMVDRVDELRQKVSNVFFGELYGAMSDTLARHPIFKKSYFQWVDEHVGWLSTEARADAIAKAKKWGLSKREIGRLEERINAMPAGELTVDDADMFAKGWALDEANGLLFDASQKSQFFDITRILFPFGEAWKEVSTRWAKLLTQNPQNLRRATQVVTGLRGADVDGNGQGFFHQDPATGEEMYSFVIDGPIMDFLGVPEVGFSGSVQGLTIANQIIPGVGPVGQFALSSVLPYLPNQDTIARLFMPYGEMESRPGALAETLVPPWINKAWQAFNADPRTDEMYARTLGEMVRVLASSGDYGRSRDEKTRLIKDAARKSQVVMAMRAGLGMFAPSAPQPQYHVETEAGDQLAGVLAKAFGEFQQQEWDGEIDSAVEKFFDTYGDGAFAYLVGKTQSTVGGQGASRAYGEWESEHEDFINEYPEVAGFFGPADEGYDSTVFNRQERQGRRTRREARQALRDAEQVAGSFMWQQFKEQAGPNPGKKRRAWLREAREEIKQKYPEWSPTNYDPNTVDARIEAIQQAVNDKDVRDTPLAAAVRTFLDYRQQVSDAAVERGHGETPVSFRTAKKSRNLRVWLREAAQEVIAETPEFKRVWEQVFEPELADDLDEE